MSTNFKHETPTRKQVQAKLDRLEAKVITDVRAAVKARDGFCRLAGIPELGPCEQWSTWAHLGEWQRFKTRGKPVEDRHCTKGSFQACMKHHRMYDDGEFDLDYGPDGANGVLTVVRKVA